MSRHPVGRAYGRALFEAALEAGALPAVLAQVPVVETALEGDLAAFLVSPKAPMAARLAVVGEIFAGADPPLAALLALAIRKGRAAQLPEILAEVRALDDAASGRATGKVTTAAPLSAGLKDELRLALSGRLGLELQLETAEDPELLGGFTARVGDRLVDASLRTRLERLRRELHAG